MSTRAEQYVATVLRREQITEHLVRIVLGGEHLAGFTSTGIPDEWVGLIVPGQFQSRYYTVRSWDGSELVLDIVVHDVGLVTEWARGECVGDEVTITEAKGSYRLPDDAEWIYLVGDLTALPAMARIARENQQVPLHAWAEVPDDLGDYFGDDLPADDVTWVGSPEEGSGLAGLVEGLTFPESPGYFWMAGESAQMRAIRKHLMREVKLPSTHYDVMGYWRGVARRQPRAVDPGPIYRAGKAAGKSDEEIWADYDAAREAE
ncbi:siderophore-interacting protein [Nocardioides sp. AE5]|uniref:siderophore-interacting protein n=1 Tax=Nocardioides sp. AE5 TaxID=2962573 RepID=UPI0028822985|nr:siderophore-interacting protein [Nocardioides sp. AE5]MDT0203278.1 siderophore-interacting protein [Nocardioides sp. AE5]